MPVEWQTVPRKSAVALAVVLHVMLVFLLLPARQKGTVRLVPPALESVKVTSARNQIVYRSSTSGAQMAKTTVTPRRRPAPAAGSNADSAALAGLRQQASQGAKALTRALWFRQIYGFYPGHDYQLAFRTSGEAHISADELPPQFEQFVIVEITIDKDGHVADARRISGLVPTAIERKLLAEVREFKYHPATRDGLPVPTQLDVVIHVPS